MDCKTYRVSPQKACFNFLRFLVEQQMGDLNNEEERMPLSLFSLCFSGHTPFLVAEVSHQLLGHKYSKKSKSSCFGTPCRVTQPVIHETDDHNAVKAS